MSDEAIITVTRRWIEAVVIGLDLCPFARRVYEAGLIRYTVSAAADEAALLADLAVELRTLVAIPPEQVETAFLIHPHVLGEFLDYNDFLGRADQLLRELGLRGTVQIAGFHPGYRFTRTKPDAVENFTNRSPFPMLHLLREASISAVANDPERLLDIPRRNVETLRGLGSEKVLDILREVWAAPPD